MKLKPSVILSASALFVAAGIAVTMATGLWQTTADKTPRKLQSTASVSEQSAAGVPASVSPDGNTAGYDPADIRGSYTFGDIARLYGVPLGDLAEAFGLTQAEAESFQVKTLEKRFPDAAQEIGTASVRLFVACELGVTYLPDDDVYLPQSALAPLNRRGLMTPGQSEYVSAHTLP